MESVIYNLHKKGLASYWTSYWIGKPIIVSSTIIKYYTPSILTPGLKYVNKKYETYTNGETVPKLWWCGNGVSPWWAYAVKLNLNGSRNGYCYAEGWSYLTAPGWICEKSL